MKASGAESEFCAGQSGFASGFLMQPVSQKRCQTFHIHLSAIESMYVYPLQKGGRPRHFASQAIAFTLLSAALNGKIMSQITIPTLSAHGATIPAIGFGTSGMGGDVRPEHIAIALKLGYRHIDTAWKYGTERAVGDGLRASGVPRAEIFLCTKVSHEYLREGDFARSVDESLGNLGVDYVDLLLVHWPMLKFHCARPWRRSPRPNARN